MLRQLCLATGLMLAAPAFAQSPAADAEAAIRAEAKVIDLLYQPGMPVEWIVSVQDDGTKRYGLASSFCDIIKAHGAANDRTIVRIVDHARMISSGGYARGASLGSVACKTYEQIDP